MRVEAERSRGGTVGSFPQERLQRQALLPLVPLEGNTVAPFRS